MEPSSSKALRLSGGKCARLCDSFNTLGYSSCQPGMPLTATTPKLLGPQALQSTLNFYLYFINVLSI